MIPFRLILKFLLSLLLTSLLFLPRAEANENSSSSNELAIINQTNLKQAVHQLIESAQNEILVAQFILLDDKSGKDIINHLIQKSRAGVQVKIIVDGIGAYSNTPLTNKKLKEICFHGIPIKVYHPKWPNIFKIKKRLHDKILIVDDVALIGSSSFWDVSFDLWQTETDILIKGATVQSIKKHFDLIWSSKEVKAIKPKKPKIEIYSGYSSLFIEDDLNFEFCEATELTYWSDGAKKTKGHGSFQNTIEHINQAKNQITIINPYFLPVPKLKKALVDAKKRGVTINLYTNSAEVLSLEYKMLGTAYSKNDSFYKKSKINVYETNPQFGMIHSKIMIVDQKKVYIGSQNLDPLGANHNTENGVCFLSNQLINKLQNDIDQFNEKLTLAFKEGTQKRNKYKARGFFKRKWRQILACIFKGVL